MRRGKNEKREEQEGGESDEDEVEEVRLGRWLNKPKPGQ